MRVPSIDQYLVATCLHIIDEFNEQYKGLEPKTIVDVANNKFNEMDITVRLGYSFRNLAHFTVGDRSSSTKKNHDIFIEAKDFKIEVKYLKNWQSSKGGDTSSASWSVFQADFDWLFSEIQAGNKGRCAFVIGWFNCVDKFAQLIQLGNNAGKYPLANEERICYFPFLHKTKVPTRTQDLEYDYLCAYEKLTVSPIGNNALQCNCVFIGSESDVFHFALFF